MLLPDHACGVSGTTREGAQPGRPRVLVSPALSALTLARHGFTTRTLQPLVDDSPAPEGGHASAPALADLAQWTRHAVKQVHAAGVREATDDTASAFPPDGDALWTAESGMLLTIRSADCVPVLMAAVSGGEGGAGTVTAVAAVHAGWRGLVAGVIAAAVRHLRGATPSSRLVGVIGPSIGPCCFEVGPEVAASLLALGDAGALASGRGDRSLADLPRLARFQLMAAGVSVPDDDPPPCTRCHADLFPSWRRDRSADRIVSFIGMLPGVPAPCA